MRLETDLYEITIDWGHNQVDHIKYHLPSLRLIGRSWALAPLKIPTRRATVEDVDKLIRFARRVGASVQVSAEWPPALVD